jgi:hypothetical protein
VFGILIAAVADSETPLYNPLLDGNNTYWVVLVGAAPLLQTISHVLERANDVEKASLIDNMGG